MVLGVRVRRPEARADRPDPWMLIAIALASLAAGLSVARGLTRDALEPASTSETHAFPELQPQAEAVPSTEGTPSTVVQADQQASAQPSTPTTGVSASTPTVPSEPELEPEPEPVAQSTTAPRAPVEAPAPAPALAAPTPPVPAMPPPEPASAPRVARQQRSTARADAVPSTTPTRTPINQDSAAPQVELGIVAYTRCDGVPQLNTRFPCPRDLRLEARVRRVINMLDRCALPPAQRGQGAVRLEFERDLPVRVSVESPRRGGFDRAAVNRCLGHSVADARTSFKPDQMVVLFYFELR